MDSDGRNSNAVSNPDKAAIEGLIERFAEGIRTLDADLISSVFHPEASSFSLTSRGICIEPAGAWPKIIEQATADDSHLFREDFSVRSLMIDIAGTAASAKVEWQFESARIIDFYCLIKTDSGWLIANQVYHTFPVNKRG